MKEFHKMHGLGNDFVICDARHKADTQALTADAMRLLADRHRGIGYDQLIILRDHSNADAAMYIYNADGSSSGMCGNALRCAAMLIADTQQDIVSIATGDRITTCRIKGDQVQVDMGEPQCDWRNIPLHAAQDTLHVAHNYHAPDGVAVNMGNPHLVLLYEHDDAPDDTELGILGYALEHDRLFPERANINIATIHDSTHIALRTWERGVGLTQACGSGACATMVAARRRGLIDANAAITMPGGTLSITWEGDETDHHHPVMMTGNACYVFHGTMAEGWAA